MLCFEIGSVCQRGDSVSNLRRELGHGLHTLVKRVESHPNSISATLTWVPERNLFDQTRTLTSAYFAHVGDRTFENYYLDVRSFFYCCADVLVGGGVRDAQLNGEILDRLTGPASARAPGVGTHSSIEMACPPRSGARPNSHKGLVPKSSVSEAKAYSATIDTVPSRLLET
jgi:hypothetical protein